MSDHVHEWRKATLPCLRTCDCGTWECEGQELTPGEHYAKHVINHPPLRLTEAQMRELGLR